VRAGQKGQKCELNYVICSQSKKSTELLAPSGPGIGSAFVSSRLIEPYLPTRSGRITCHLVVEWFAGLAWNT
jgi:hypothetical protein